jgi:hypothetical protein
MGFPPQLSFERGRVRVRAVYEKEGKEAKQDMPKAHLKVEKAWVA